MGARGVPAGERPVRGARSRLAPGIEGRWRGDPRADLDGRSAGRTLRGCALAREARRSAADRRSVRGAVHPEPGRGAGGLRRAAGSPAARGGPLRAAVDARRLSLSLSGLRSTGSGLLRNDAAGAADGSVAAPRRRPAGPAMRLPVRGRVDRRGDAGRSGGPARRPPAAGVRGGPALGAEKPQSGSPDESRLSAGRWGQRCSGSARRGDPGASRREPHPDRA